MTFSESVVVTGVPELILQVGDSNRIATYRSGTGTSALVFRYMIAEGELDSDGVSVAAGAIQTSRGVVRYLSTKNPAPAKVELAAQSAHLVDAVRPGMVSARALANESTLTLTYDKALDETSQPTPRGVGFRVRDEVASSNLDISTIHVSGKVVTLTLAEPVSAGDQLTVFYGVPFRTYPPLKDTLGNYATSQSTTVSITQRPNSPPEFPSSGDGARSIDENTAASRNIGAAIAATDADNDGLTYSLSGTDAAFFDVVTASGQLRTKGALNHESRESYSFTMSVHDGKDIHGNAATTVDDTISVTVRVNDVDEPADISFTPTSGVTAINNALAVDENHDGALATFSASDPENKPGLTYTWSPGGRDRGNFTITEAGVLSFSNIPDYERPGDSGGNNVYNTGVDVRDSDNKLGFILLTVTVRPVNEPPVITGDGSPTFDENANINNRVARYTAADPERDSFEWSVGGTDASSFTIDTSGNLKFNSQPDHEDKDEYSITIVAMDDANPPNAGEYAVTVTVTPVDEPPVITGVTTIDDYEENGVGGVATYTAADPEGDSNITWSLGGPDWGDFDITGGVLTFKNVPDYERPADSGGNNQYEVTVQATDATNNRGELHVDVIVADVNEPPELTGPDTVDDFPENSATSRQVGRYTASDPEGATVNLSLSSGGSDFTLAGNGVLTFKEPPDYEEQRSYSVTVRAEAGSHTLYKVVTVNIQNVEEPGAITLSAVQPQEGTSLTATLDDDDGPTGTTWQWRRASSRGSTGSAIDGATSDTYTPDSDDVGSYLRITTSYDDGHSTGKTATEVSANRVQEAPPQPEAPVFPADADYGRSIRENTRPVSNLGAPVRATDANNDRLTYSIPASDDFQIEGRTGQLRTKRMLNHEGQEQHFVSVTATDPGGLTDTATVAITVEDVDETPVVTGPG